MLIGGFAKPSLARSPNKVDRSACRFILPELSQQLGRSATSAEIAVVLELEPAQIREYLNISRSPISLDAKVGDRQDTELSELLEDDGISPEKYTVQESLRQELQATLDELTRQQREVINLRFGLEGGTELSLAKVGEILNLSRERVRQLEHQALAHFRRRHSSFRDYVAS
jgi:RNA polymerase nonessential primary-like sigma factor